MPLTQETFAALVLEDTDGRWEIHRQRLREKPPMSIEHSEAASDLQYQLMEQLPRASFRVRLNAGHLRTPSGDSYIPDVCVVPIALVQQLRTVPRTFERYDDALPLVAEVWSPSTGSYDVDAKIPGYKARGDAEIWRVQPYDRRVTVWRRRADGAYDETIHLGGTIEISSLPGVVVDLDRLFETLG